MPICAPFPRVKVPKHKIIVTSPFQMAGGGLRSDVVYELDGGIDFSGISILVPTNGITIHSLDLNIGGMTATDAGQTLFINEGAVAGSVFLRNMFVEVSGAGSQVFDLDNAGNGGAVECTDFNFVNCKSLGVLDNYRQGLWDSFATIACVDGLTMEGTWAGGFAILTSIIVSSGTAFTGTLLKKGTSLVVNGSIRSDMNALQLDASGAVCDFEPANITNDANFLMNGVRVNPSSTAFPNMPASSVKAKFVTCTGTDNTFVGGQWTVTTEVATALGSESAGTFLKVAGTTTSSNLQWISAPASNKLVNLSSQPISVDVTFNISMAGTNNDVVTLKIVQYNSSDVFIADIFISGGDTMNAGGRVEGASGEGFATLASGDYVQLEASSSGAKNVTAAENGRFIVKERAS